MICKHLDILVSSDNRGVGPLSVLLRSLALSNPNLIGNIYILDDEISPENKDTLNGFGMELGLHLIFVPVNGANFDESLARMPQKRLPRAALFRCTMDRLLPRDVHRVLYLDIDTIVLGSLEELLEYPLDDCVAAVMPENKAYMVDEGVPVDRYFNSGVMLVNLDEWRDQKITEQTLEVLAAKAEKLRLADQCALNVSLLGKTSFLDRSYNYIPKRKPEDFPFPYPVPIILHYAGRLKKPWIDPKMPWGFYYCMISAGTPWPVDYDIQEAHARRSYKKKNPLRRAIIRLARKIAAD